MEQKVESRSVTVVYYVVGVMQAHLVEFTGATEEEAEGKRERYASRLRRSAKLHYVETRINP